MGNDNLPFEFEGVNPFADPFLGQDLGPYHIESRLGQGGMGIVYRGIHRNLQRPVAIKVLSASADGFDSEAITRFHQEALAYAKVRHPNVVEIYESGAAKETQYLALELVEGKSLQEILNEQGVLEDYHIIEMGEQLCAALTTIHAAGLVHRDIKLGNVMISESGFVKLMDFGVVRARTGKGAKKSAEVGGTLRCMAPEVVEGEPGDSRADIFQLGALFYELLTGETFSVLTPNYLEDIEQSFFRGTATELRPDVSDALKELVIRCLQRSPALRFQSAGVVARELVRVRKEGSDYVSRRRLKSASGDKHPTEQQKIIGSAFSWLRNQYRLNPQPFAIALLVLLIGLMTGVAYFLLPEADDGQDKDPLLNQKGRTLQLGETIEVRPGIVGFELRWDVGDTSGLTLNASFRVAGGEPIFISSTFDNLSGRKFFPIEGTDPMHPTSLGWRVEHENIKVTGGRAAIGFHPIMAHQRSAKSVAVAFMNSHILVGTDAGVLNCFDLDKIGEKEGLLRSFLLGDNKSVSGLFLDGQYCYASFGSAASSQICKIDLTRPEGKEQLWTADYVFGLSARKAAKIGSELFWLTSVGHTGRNFLIALNEDDGKKKKNRILKGMKPLSPLSLKDHLLVAYNRKGRGVLTRIKSDSLKRQWHHIIDEEIDEPLTLDPTNTFIYFKSKKHVHRLRLFEKPFAGKRTKSVSLGDFRKELPGVASLLRLTDLSMYLTVFDDKEQKLKILSLPAGINSGHEKFTEKKVEIVTPSLAKVDGAAAPILAKSKCYLPLGQYLYVINSRSDEKVFKFKFPTDIVEIEPYGKRIFIALADGRIFNGMLPD